MDALPYSLQNWIKDDPEVKKFYLLAFDIITGKLNKDTVFYYFKTDEDVKYLFKVNSLKVLLEIKRMLKLINKNAGDDEKQIIDFLLQKKRVYKSCIVVIICLVGFHFLLCATQGSKSKTLARYKFENIEDTVLFLLYVNYNIANRFIKKLVKKAQMLPVKKVVLMAFLLKSNKLMNSALARWEEDHRILELVSSFYEPFYKCLSQIMLNLANKECFKILQVKNLDKIRISKMLLLQCTRQFIKTKKLMYFYRNMSINEICFNIDITAHLFRKTNGISAINVDLSEIHNNMYFLDQKHKEISSFSKQTSDIMGHTVSSPKHSAISVEYVRKIIYAWLRIFILTGHFSMFVEIFEKLKESSDEEFKVLSKIYQKLINSAKFDINDLKKYKDDNEFAPAAFTELVKFF